MNILYAILAIALCAGIGGFLYGFFVLKDRDKIIKEIAKACLIGLLLYAVILIALYPTFPDFNSINITRTLFLACVLGFSQGVIDHIFAQLENQNVSLQSKLDLLESQITLNDIDTRLKRIEELNNRHPDELEALKQELSSRFNEIASQNRKSIDELVSHLYQTLEIHKKQIDEVVENLAGEPTLDNFQGTVLTNIFDLSGDKLSPSAEGDLKVLPKQPLLLNVSLCPSYTEKNEDNTTQSISIKNGNSVKDVTFEVSLDSETVNLSNTSRKSLTIHLDPKSESPSLSFNLNAPDQKGRHEIWVEIFQKNKLIQVLTTQLFVDYLFNPA
jgi:hypothetical protein